jgi:hypothetical protein
MPVHVAAAEAGAQPALIGTQPAGSAAGLYEVLGQDIVYIKESPGKLAPVGERWYHMPGWLAWCFGPVVVIGISEGFRLSRRRLTADPAALRASGAMQRALTAAQRASRLIQAGKVTEYHDEAFRIVQRYIGERFNRSSAGLTQAELQQTLRARGVAEDLVQEVASFFDRSDAARFAPASVAADQVHATQQSLESLPKRLERAAS